MATAKTKKASLAGELQLEQVQTADLIPYAVNSRTHDDDQITQIAASIREFGFLVPILADDDNNIIAGHGRLEAAKKLKLDTVPVVRASHLSPAQRRAYVIADNRLALNAGWDNELLKLELTDLNDLNFDVSLLGFTDDEIADFLSPLTDGETDPDDVPDVPETPVTVEGDVWLLGKHRLLCGDSTSIEAVERLLCGELADMWLTDPPYNVDYTGKTKNALKIKNDEKTDAEFRQFLTDAITAADANMKAGAVFYIWHADSEGFNFRGACHDSGWTVRQCLIWNKQTMVMGRQDYHWKHEPCLYGWKDGAGHLWATDRKQTTILEFDRPSRSESHPTMKPVALFEYQMLNNTKGSDVILDSFAGSGTTVIVAEKNGRIARAMELDPAYCDVIVKRWEAFTGLQATLEATGQTFAEAALKAA